MGFWRSLVIFGIGFLFQITTAQAAVFSPQKAKLSNGMEIVVVTQRLAPVVYHSVWYRVGSADEKPGQSGIAHFLEHLMFKSTKKIGDGQFSKIVKANGGVDNAFTSWDYTAYFQIVPKNKLNLVMGMEADRMVNLELTEKQVVTERDVIVRERMERTDSNPQRLLGEESLASIFRNHRYGIPIIGWQHEIKSLTREIAFDFYNTWYRPNNAIMIVVGDITLAEVLPLAEKHFGSHEPGPIPDRSRVKEPPQRGSKKITYSDKRVQQPVFERTYLVDSQKLNPGDNEALEILADLLAGGSNSRMTHELVIERQLAVNVSAGYWELHDYGLFEIMVTPKRGVSLEVIEAAIDKIMAETLSDNHQFDLEDFEKSKESYLDNATFARDGLDGIGRIIGQALTNLRFDMDKFEKSPERAAMVTFERVLQVAKENIDPSSAVTSWLIPEPAKVVAPEKSKKATVVAAPKEKTNKKAVSR